MQNRYFSTFRYHPYIVTIATPFLFVAATLIVEKFGIEARGSGIPQVLQAIDEAGDEKDEAPADAQ